MNTDYVTQTKREEKMQLIREGVIGSVAFILLVALVFFAFHLEAEAGDFLDRMEIQDMQMQQQQQEMQMQQLQEQQRQMQQQMQYQQMQNNNIRVRPYGSSCIGYGCPSLH